jgi:hypothetical protein
MGLAFCLAAFAVGAVAQSGTTMTNSNNGTTGTIPEYTGSATLGNSAIIQSGGNIGIGTTAPVAPLHVNGTGSADTTTPAIHVNAKSTSYSIDFGAIAYDGGYIQGSQGIGTSANLLLNPLAGNVGIGVLSPTAIFQVVESTTGPGTVSVNGARLQARILSLPIHSVLETRSRSLLRAVRKPK